MPSLLLAVFLVQLAIHLINTFGAAALNNLVRPPIHLDPPKRTSLTPQLQLWTLYTKLPTRTSRAAADQSRLRRDVVRLKRELNGTSSQDEFAKWAKLRRQHDKALGEYEAKSSLPFPHTHTLSFLHLHVSLRTAVADKQKPTPSTPPNPPSTRT